MCLYFHLLFSLLFLPKFCLNFQASGEYTLTTLRHLFLFQYIHLAQLQAPLWQRLYRLTPVCPVASSNVQCA